MIFPPFQYPEIEWRGGLLHIERVGATLGAAVKGAEPGRVVAVDDEGLAVAAGDRTLRIRQIAMKHQIPIVERKPLARALYRNVKVGQEVPPEFYKAVAEILAYVYRLGGRMAG